LRSAQFFLKTGSPLFIKTEARDYNLKLYKYKVRNKPDTGRKKKNGRPAHNRNKKNKKEPSSPSNNTFRQKNRAPRTGPNTPKNQSLERD
jgi:hypothetical protein